MYIGYQQTFLALSDAAESMNLFVDITYSLPLASRSVLIDVANALCSFGRGARVQPARRIRARRRQHQRLPGRACQDGQCGSVPICGPPCGKRVHVQRQWCGRLLADGLRLVQSRRQLLLQHRQNWRRAAVCPPRLRRCTPLASTPVHVCFGIRCTDACLPTRFHSVRASAHLPARG